MVGSWFVGGIDNDDTELTTTEVLDVAQNTVSAGPKCGTPRYFGTAVKLPGDRILAIGRYAEKK